MNSHEYANLDQELQDMKGDVNWREERRIRGKHQLLSKIEETEISNQPQVKRPMKNKLVPLLALVMIIGIATMLMVNERTSNEQAIELNETLPGSTSGDAPLVMQDFPYDMSNKTEQDVNEIVEAGFDLRLPQSSISDDMYIINSHLRTTEDIEEATTLFGYGDDKQIRLSQESLKKIDEARIQGRVEQIKEEATNQFTLENNRTAYFYDGENGITLYILTEPYGFVLHSHSLSTEQIVSLANSIDLNNLE